MVTIRYTMGTTILGPVFLARTDRGLRALFLLDQDDPRPALALLDRAHPGEAIVADPRALAPALDRVHAWLATGESGDDVPLDLRGSPFQQRVWAALHGIPPGETRTYSALAQALELPRASRAVGAACGANPVALFVPCHRVVAANGRLGGYRWGLERKRRLLDLERTWSRAPQPPRPSVRGTETARGTTPILRISDR